jgi:hypothetical protein
METNKPQSSEDSYGPPSPTNIYEPPALKDTYYPSSMETYNLPSPEGSYASPSLMDIYKPSTSVNVNFSVPTNTHKPPFSVDDYKTFPPAERDKLPLVMDSHKPTTHINVYKFPSSTDISNLSPPPMKFYITPLPADENRSPLYAYNDTYKPPIMNYPQPNASFDKSPPYNDDSPLSPFKGLHKPYTSSDITIKDSYTMPLSEEDQPEHNSSSDDEGYPEYDTQDHDSHDHDTYDNTKDHISHNSHDSHRDPNKYYHYHHHHSYDNEDHEIPAAHPPSKDHYHHPALYEYEGGVPQDHYRDHTHHHDPNEHYSDHHLQDYDEYELPALHRPIKHNYLYPSSHVYKVETPSLPEEPSPRQEMMEYLTSPSNGMVGSSTPPANNMDEPATSPPPDMTQGPPPPPKDMVEVPPPPPKTMYGASPYLPMDMYANHLYPVEDMYGVHPPIYEYGTPTPTKSSDNMTEAPQTSTTPMEKKKPHAFYYLGRKLWLFPVFATGILLVQMLLLLLKAIVKHKVKRPYDFFTNLQSRNLKSRRKQELDSSTEHVTKALETAEYRYI